MCQCYEFWLWVSLIIMVMLYHMCTISMVIFIMVKFVWLTKIFYFTCWNLQHKSFCGWIFRIRHIFKHYVRLWMHTSQIVLFSLWNFLSMLFSNFVNLQYLMITIATVYWHAYSVVFCCILLQLSFTWVSEANFLS